MAPLVSVVLPVYSPHPRFFREAVQSILRQTFTDFELIIVEDPSPASGKPVVDDLADPRIRHVVNPARTSLAEQHNRGLALSRGEFICRFDADDISEPQRIERELNHLTSHPDIDVVSSALLVIDEEGNAVAIRRYPPTDAEIKRTFRRSNPIANSAVMFRRAVYDQFGGWRTDSALPAQDYDWYSRLGAAGVRFANLTEPLVRYRLHSGSIKSTRLRETIRSTLETKRRYWSREMTVADRFVMAAERLLVLAPQRVVLFAFRVMRLQRWRST